jgi:hypothetical protein
MAIHSLFPPTLSTLSVQIIDNNAYIATISVFESYFDIETSYIV